MKNSKKNSKVRKGPLDRDLSDLFDQKGWEKVRFEILPKNKSITLRISDEMLAAIKLKAEKQGIDYQKWIRSSLEDALNRSA
jgi:predicted DNA binding CopG/RHH family protein